MPLLFMLLGALLAYQPIHDMDLPMHVAAGRWILAHGIPHQDPFSYTAAGRPWVDHEWLSQVVFALTERAGGIEAIKILGCALVGLGLCLWHQAFRAAGLARFGAACLTLLVAILFTHRVHVRPHLFGFLAEALFVLALFRPPRTRALQAAAALGFLLWVQLHGGWLLALMVLGATAAAAALRQGPRAALRPGLVAVVLAALACVNPAGWRVYHAPFSVSGISALIPEWWSVWALQAFDQSYFDKRIYAEALLLLALLGLLLGWRGALPATLGLTMVCGFLGWSSARFLYLLPLTLVPLAGARWPATLTGPQPRTLLLLALLAVLGKQLGDRWTKLFDLPGGPGALFYPQRFPEVATDRLQAAQFAGTVFAPPTWTSYLLYRLGEAVRVCIDGRVEVYGAAIASDMLRMDRPPGSHDLVARYPADVVLTPHGWMAGGPPGYVLVHRDDLAELFVRDTPGLAPVRGRLRTGR
jgi:hypothetical protein